MCGVKDCKGVWCESWSLWAWRRQASVVCKSVPAVRGWVAKGAGPRIAVLPVAVLLSGSGGKSARHWQNYPQAVDGARQLSCSNTGLSQRRLTVEQMTVCVVLGSSFAVGSRVARLRRVTWVNNREDIADNK